MKPGTRAVYLWEDDENGLHRIFCKPCAEKAFFELELIQEAEADEECESCEASNRQ